MGEGTGEGGKQRREDKGQVGVKQGRGTWSKWELFPPTLMQQPALGCTFSPTFSSMQPRTSLFAPKYLYTSGFQSETKAKILIGVTTMAKVIFLIFYIMFGKTQKGIILCDTKFKKWLHPLVCRFAKVFFNENRRKWCKKVSNHWKKQLLTC